MKNLLTLIDEIKTRPLSISVTAKGEQVQQTQRNKLKAELMAAILADLKEEYEYVYPSADGILIEIANDSVADNTQSEEGSGAITIALDLKIKNLDTNAEQDSEVYLQEVAEKEAKKKADAEKKAAKIARDKAARAAKTKAKAEEV